MGNNKQIKIVSVLGSKGMLGYAISEYFKEKGYQVNQIDRVQFDPLINPIKDLEEKLTGSNFVVNCIGIIKPRIANMKIEDVFMVNGTFPKNLAKLANKLNIPCFHVTTDCVYSGSQGKYSEDDYFDIDDTYGLSKNAGESTDCMTLRTSIIGEELNNKYSLLEWAKSQKGKNVTGFNNHLWNGVTTLYLAEIIEKIMQENKYAKGIYHLYSPTPVTKYELLNIINDSYNLSLQIAKSDAPVKVDRTLSSIFPLSKAIVNKELSDQISEMYKFFVEKR